MTEVSELQKKSREKKSTALKLAQQVAGHNAALRERAEKEKKEEKVHRRKRDKQLGEA